MDNKKRPYVQTALKLKQFRGPLQPKAFAKMLGVERQSYYRYERGERETPEPVMKLAEILGHRLYNKDRKEENFTKEESSHSIEKDSIAAGSGSDPLAILKESLNQVFLLIEKEHAELKQRNDTLERVLDVLARNARPLEQEKRSAMREISQIIDGNQLLNRAKRRPCG